MPATKILPGVRIDGKILGSADVKVEGEVHGEISLSSSIYIARSGKVNAAIKAVNVYVAGDFTGNIAASEFIQVSAGGKANGEIKAPAISIEKGAKFTGKIEMVEEESASTVISEPVAVEQENFAATSEPTVEEEIPAAVEEIEVQEAAPAAELEPEHAATPAIKKLTRTAK